VNTLKSVCGTANVVLVVGRESIVVRSDLSDAAQIQSVFVRIQVETAHQVSEQLHIQSSDNSM